MRARRLARAARFRAGLARHDAVVAHSPTAFFRFLGDVVALIYVALLRRVGPVLVILTVVVVVALGRSLARRAFDTARRLFALGANKSVFLVDVVVEAPAEVLLELRRALGFCRRRSRCRVAEWVAGASASRRPRIETRIVA